MEKIILAIAVMVASASAAAAQTPATPPLATRLPVGVLGVAAAPSIFLGGNNILNQDGGPIDPVITNPATPPEQVETSGRDHGVTLRGARQR